MKKRHLRGSITVEMSFLIPIILMILMTGMLAAFYFHDKNILNGAAYEAAVVGSTKMREKEQIDEAELISLCKDRADGKCILFSGYSVDVSISEEEIVVGMNAMRKNFRVSVEKKAAVTEPEKKIRDLRRIKELGNGTKNND